MNTAIDECQRFTENTRLFAETVRQQTLNVRHQAEIGRNFAESVRLHAETVQFEAMTRGLSPETKRLQAGTGARQVESRWFSVRVFGGALAGAVAVFTAAALFLKFVDWLRPSVSSGR